MSLAGDRGATATSHSGPASSPGVRGGCDLLVVDDEPIVRDAVRRVLEAEGYSVATACDARSALAHPAASTCRALLCDLMLPDRPGTEVVAALAAARPNLPIVLTTGLVTSENIAGAMEAAKGRLLLKPFDDTELLAAIREALGARVVSDRAASQEEDSP